MLYPSGSAVENDIFAHCIVCSTEPNAKSSFQQLCTSYFTRKLHTFSGYEKEFNKLAKLIFLQMYKLSAFDPYHVIPVLLKPSVLFYPVFFHR